MVDAAAVYATRDSHVHPALRVPRYSAKSDNGDDALTAVFRDWSQVERHRLCVAAGGRHRPTTHDGGRATISSVHAPAPHLSPPPPSPRDVIGHRPRFSSAAFTSTGIAPKAVPAVTHKGAKIQQYSPFR